MKITLFILGIVATLFSGCSSSSSNDTMTYVLEITTFKIKATANASDFNKMDADVEKLFTSKQPGFISRKSGINEEGEYVVLVNWNTTKDAAASMQKFMNDASVADYASMIDAATMKMARYAIKDELKASSSNFVEVMTFNTKEDTDMTAFNKINKKVETDVTAKREGFLQRIVGISDDNMQVVAIYWDTKANSDAALQPFMDNSISKKFMGMMDQSTIWMGRYSTPVIAKK